MNNWMSPFYSLLFLALWRMSYEAENSIEQGSQAEKTQSMSTPQSENPPTSQKEWAEKAVRKYTEAQEMKWRNWQEAMFEIG